MHGLLSVGVASRTLVCGQKCGEVVVSPFCNFEVTSSILLGASTRSLENHLQRESLTVLGFALQGLGGLCQLLC